ncbi:hypothetical protein K474DRAFT_1667839 [Panus rudis PR-1116 ss-1]|nr:hypothetical protein K474DRAFT_1667839 [Panus rudis PR-1116 ss-1]
MKSTCKVLGSTFEVLGEQTMRVAALGPAIDAKRQISSARKSMDEQFKRQEKRMLEVKTMLKDKLLDETFKGHMRDVVSEIVAEIVKREIAERVRIQLQEQIPQAMRDQVVEYQQKILEVKTSLYNSEARRHNALIQSNSLDEPLKPLLRPMQSTVNSPAPVSSIPKGSAVSAKPTSPPPKSSSPKATTTKKTTPNTPAAAETDAPDTSALSIQVEGSSTVGSTNTGRPVRPRVVTDLAPPTPSPFFPRDLTTLLKLGDNETKTLMQDYGLVPMRHPGTPLAQEGEAASAGLAAPDEQLEGSREENLNKFLNHIGVGFQLVPSPTGGKAPPTPFVTMMAH